MACVSVAMVAGKDDSLEAGNTVSYKSVAGVSMNERIKVDIYFFNFVAGRKPERYLRSEVLPRGPPPPPQKKNHQVPCLRQREGGTNTGVVRVSWKGKQVEKGTLILLAYTSRKTPLKRNY